MGFLQLTVLLTAAFLTESAEATEFRAVDCLNGSEVRVFRNVSPATAVVFLGTECPMARSYAPVLQRLEDDLSGKGLRVIGVISNRQDSVRDIARYAAETGLRIPLVRDERNQIADQYNARRTPEAFLLDADLQIVYRGRIDDRYQPGVARDKPTREDLREAVEETLSGLPVSVPQTNATGCLIGRVTSVAHPADERPNNTDITWSRDVRPMLRRHCEECHRAGDIGPFAVHDYDEVSGWAPTMLEVIDNGRMPPWHADSAVGSFANARTMPPSDRDILAAWISSGMPRGTEDDSASSPVLSVEPGLLKEADAEFAMSKKPFQVPAEGVVEYQYFVVDPGLPEDRWVKAAEVIPGNRSVVHHAIVFIRPPDGEEFRGIGWLTAYVPGQRTVALPPGYGRRIPAGSRLVFQMHYTPNGKAQEDLTRVRIAFVDDDSGEREIITLIGIDQDFEIPPNAANHEVTRDVGRFPEDGELLGIMPHMHYRGRSFELSAELKDGTQKRLLHVPRYDFNWQHFYELTNPLPLRNVEEMSFTATFDNSSGNPFNPDPNEWVTWGDQTWEEMAVVFLEVAEPRRDRLSSLTSDVGDSAVPEDPEREKRIEQFVSRFFSDLDSDQDGVILKRETATVVRSYVWSRFDHNNDNRITRDEVRQRAEQIIRR